MHIYFDLYEISLGEGKSIGIYNYAIAVLKTLANTNKLTISVACSGANVNEIKEIPNIKINIISKVFPNYYNRLFWRLFYAMHLAKKENVDIFYSPKGFAPAIFKRRRKPFIVITVHDMIPFFYLEHFPKYFSKFENQFITKSLKHSINMANSIITVSGYSKEMIIKYTKRKDNINIIYNDIPKNRKKYSEIESPYIFAITSNLPHKNKKNIIQGYLEYKNIAINPLPLKICGITSQDLDLPKEQQTGIECIKYADEFNFSILFSNASIFLFLSHIEGFGFPPLEALDFGIPPIVSDTPIMREILGESAYYVNQTNPKEIGESINIVLSNSKIAENILSIGKTVLQKYSWDKSCTQIISVFNETIKNNQH